MRAIIAVAKALDLSIVGECIETQEQAVLLGAWGCDPGQGFYFGKAMDEQAVTSLLRAAGHGQTAARVA